MPEDLQINFTKEYLEKQSYINNNIELYAEKRYNPNLFKKILGKDIGNDQMVIFHENNNIQTEFLDQNCQYFTFDPENKLYQLYCGKYTTIDNSHNFMSSLFKEDAREDALNEINKTIKEGYKNLTDDKYIIAEYVGNVLDWESWKEKLVSALKYHKEYSIFNTLFSVSSSYIDISDDDPTKYEKYKRDTLDFIKSVLSIDLPVNKDDNKKFNSANKVFAINFLYDNNFVNTLIEKFGYAFSKDHYKYNIKKSDEWDQASVRQTLYEIYDMFYEMFYVQVRKSIWDTKLNDIYLKVYGKKIKEEEENKDKKNQFKDDASDGFIEPNYNSFYEIVEDIELIPNALRAHIIKKKNVRESLMEKPKDNIDISLSDGFDYIVMIINHLIDKMSSMPQSLGNTGTILVQMMQIMETICKHIDKKVMFVVLLEYLPVLSSVIINIAKNNNINIIDKHRILALSNKFNDVFKTYNDIHGTKFKTIDDTFVDFTSPDTFIDMQKQIEDSYPQFLTVPFQRQKDYEDLKGEANLMQQLDVSRAYKIITAEIVLNEYSFKDDQLYRKILSNGFTLNITKYDIINKLQFPNKPPKAILLTPWQTNIKNIYNFILNTAYEKYHTYRQTNRYSRGIKKHGVEVGKILYPQGLINGDASNSNDNYQFIDNLKKCIDLKNSAINSMNFSIDVPTSMFISKKIYGDPNVSIIEFENTGNMHLKLCFGYNQEILGKCLFGINFDYMNAKLGNDTFKLENNVVNLIIESDETNEVINLNSIYELYTMIESNGNIKINSFGFIS